MDDNKIDGGFLIPRVVYIDEARPGLLFTCIRIIGGKFIYLGLWMKSLSYTKKEIHPYEDLLNAMKRAKVERGE